MVTTLPPKRWFEPEAQYTYTDAYPLEIGMMETLGLVRVYPSKKTQPGWGATEFAGNHAAGHFRPARVLRFYDRYNAPFGIIMRSIPVLCVDIDGKNGGIEMSDILELPMTLAEKSKSGNGYHLFYKVPGDWDELRGYNQFTDVIGLVPGVDIKGTGIVYHYPNQTWNTLEMVDLPESLSHLLARSSEAKRTARITREGVSKLDEDDLVILHDQLKYELFSTKFPSGNRNNKLFAIGAKMASAFYPAWDTALYDRGLEIGLGTDEITDIINNIEKYT